MNSTKVKKLKDKRNPKQFISSLFFAIIAMVIAVTLFVGMLFLQNYFAADVVYKDIIIAANDIPMGEIITKENFNDYFKVGSVNIANTTEGAMTAENAKLLVGRKTIVPLYKGEEISLKDFNNVSVYLDNIENPVEISVEVGALATSDGGKVRAGDLVNITLMFSKEQLSENISTEVNPTEMTSSNKKDYSFGKWVEENLGAEETESIEEIVEESQENENSLNSYYITNDNTTTISNSWKNEKTKYSSFYNFESYSQYVLENIYVKEVLTSDGVLIDPTDTTSIASVYIFVIPREMELELNNALENCTSMRVSRVLNNIVEEETPLTEEVIESTEATVSEVEVKKEEVQ